MSGAPALIIDEPNGFAVDFTYGGGITATLAVTEIGSDTVAFVGTVAAFPERTATLAVTEVGPDTAAAAGAVAIAGMLAVSEVGADAAALVGSSAIMGTLDAIEAGNDMAEIVLRMRAVEANVGLVGSLAPVARLSGNLSAPQLRGRV